MPSSGTGRVESQDAIRRLKGFSEPRPDVCLVLMPYAMLEHPSLALGLLKAELLRSGIRAEVIYANLGFAGVIGLDAYRLIESLARALSVGDWTFAGAAFPGRRCDAAAHLRQVGEIIARRYGPAPYEPAQAAAVARALAGIRRQASRFTDRLARAIAARGPRIVGCSSNYEQHAASLALLRRIRELSPGIRTLIGGANCEAEMGEATLQACPWVDAVFSGEADAAIAPLCRMLAGSRRRLFRRRLPAGVLVRGRAAGARPTRAVFEPLARTPIPDYEDYFRALAASPLRGRIAPALVIEGSRGCWWGEHRPCSFCGRHEAGMRYRAKPAQRLLAEMDVLSARHGVRRFALADNILDPRLVRTLFPVLRDRGRPYDMVAETKSGLSRDQVRTLAAGGLRWIQPGIESLHDGPLRLMNKGVSALANVRLLQHAREFGVAVTWNLLYGLPGEQDAWRAELANVLPWLAHLQPPESLVPVLYVRGSAYHRNPMTFGLKLAAFPAFRHAFPVPRPLRDRMAFYFHDEAESDPARAPRFTGPGLARLLARAREWQGLWRTRLPPILAMTERGQGLDLYDTRPCARVRRIRLSGPAATLYRQCRDGTSEAGLIRHMGARHADWIRRTLSRWTEQGLVLPIRGVYLALAVPGDIPDPPGPTEYPGGSAPARFRDVVMGWCGSGENASTTGTVHPAKSEGDTGKRPRRISVRPGIC